MLCYIWRDLGEAFIYLHPVKILQFNYQLYDSFLAYCQLAYLLK